MECGLALGVAGDPSGPGGFGRLLQARHLGDADADALCGWLDHNHGIHNA